MRNQRFVYFYQDQDGYVMANFGEHTEQSKYDNVYRSWYVPYDAEIVKIAINAFLEYGKVPDPWPKG